MELEGAAEKLKCAYRSYRRDRSKLEKFEQEITSLIGALDAEVKIDFDRHRSQGSADSPNFNGFDGFQDALENLQISRCEIIKVKNLFRDRGLQVNPTL